MKGLLKRIVMAALVLAACLPMMVTEPATEAAAKYQYTIRIYAGQQGYISGQEEVSYQGLNYGDRVNFNLRDVQLKDGSKYYVKGIRLAGRDNNTIGVTSFLVEGDADYVIAYGLLTDAVMYTIEYVDADGNELAPAEHYYGNVGDKPVVAFLYIEGYRPNAYNLTKTLSANAADNVFRFVYTRTENGTRPGGTGDGGDEGGDEPGTTPEGAPNINPGGIPVIPAEEQNNGVEIDTEFIPDSNVPMGNGPEGLVDLDEPETPLSNFVNVMNEAHILGVPLWAVLLTFGIIVLAVVAYVVHEHVKKRRADRL